MGGASSALTRRDRVETVVGIRARWILSGPFFMQDEAWAAEVSDPVLAG